jgi:hypothetical protein
MLLLFLFNPSPTKSKDLPPSLVPCMGSRTALFCTPRYGHVPVLLSLPTPADARTQTPPAHVYAGPSFMPKKVRAWFAPPAR